MKMAAKLITPIAARDRGKKIAIWFVEFCDGVESHYNNDSYFPIHFYAGSFSAVFLVRLLPVSLLPKALQERIYKESLRNISYRTQ